MSVVKSVTISFAVEYYAIDEEMAETPEYIPYPKIDRKLIRHLAVTQNSSNISQSLHGNLNTVEQF